MFMTDDMDEEAPREFQTETSCPSCGQKLYFIFYRTRVSYEEAVEIETFFCKKCLYKSSQIRPLESDSPKKLVLEVRNHDDLRTILYRSPEAKIEIPELEAEIDPGEISTGEITTIEGVLTRLLENMKYSFCPHDGHEVSVWNSLGASSSISSVINIKPGLPTLAHPSL